MTHESLRSAAQGFKIVAITFNVAIFRLNLPRLLYSHRVADILELCAMAVLSLLPNRWLVSTRAAFILSLLLSLFPSRDFFSLSALKDLDFLSAR